MNCINNCNPLHSFVRIPVVLDETPRINGIPIQGENSIEIIKSQMEQLANLGKTMIKAKDIKEKYALRELPSTKVNGAYQLNDGGYQATHCDEPLVAYYKRNNTVVDNQGVTLAELHDLKNGGFQALNSEGNLLLEYHPNCEHLNGKEVYLDKGGAMCAQINELKDGGFSVWDNVGNLIAEYHPESPFSDDKNVLLNQSGAMIMSDIDKNSAKEVASMLVIANEAISQDNKTRIECAK